MQRHKKTALGITGLTLLFIMVLAGCENGVSPVSIDGTVNSTAIAAPQVSTDPVTGGIKLSWAPIVEASGYTLWRKAAADSGDIPLTSGGPQFDGATGKYVYLDLVADDNPLTAATEYTYTVIAQAASSTRENSTWTGKATPTDIPAKGTQLAAPTAVGFTFDEDSGKVQVTVTAPAAGVIPPGYYVTLYQDGYSAGQNYITGTSGEITWSNQEEGDYQVRVYGGISGSGSYYKNSEAVASVKQTYTKAFGSNDYLYVSGSPTLGTGTGSSTIQGYSISINGSLTVITGYTYTLERAKLDESGNPGAYTAVTPQKRKPNTTPVAYEDAAINEVNGGIDAVGTPQSGPTLYDRAFIEDTAAAGTYRYRINAVKGTETPKYLESQSSYGQVSYFEVTIGSVAYIQGQISVSAPQDIPDDGSALTGKKYTITPSLTYKGALQTGDKLVVYWLKANNSYDFRYGPWNADNKVEFTKTDLEAASIATQDITVPFIESDEYNAYIFAQAFIVLNDGTRISVQNWSNYSWNTSSSGISNSGGGYYDAANPSSGGGGGGNSPNYAVQLNTN